MDGKDGRTHRNMVDTDEHVVAVILERRLLDCVRLTANSAIAMIVVLHTGQGPRKHAGRRRINCRTHRVVQVRGQQAASLQVQMCVLCLVLACGDVQLEGGSGHCNGRFQRQEEIAGCVRTGYVCIRSNTGKPVRMGSQHQWRCLHWTMSSAPMVRGEDVCR